MTCHRAVEAGGVQGGGWEGLGAWRGEGMLRAPRHRACCPVRGQWEWPLAELTAQPSGDPAQLYTRTKGKDPPALPLAGISAHRAVP